MPPRAVTQFQPGKTPVQTRAALTVDAISEATLQGTTRYVLEAGASPAMIRSLRRHLVVLCHTCTLAQVAPRR